MICLYDIEKVGDAHILPGDPASHITGLTVFLSCRHKQKSPNLVEFRVVALRPWLEEVCLGKIRAANKSGVYLSVEFFDDIFVPADKLPNPSVLFVDLSFKRSYAVAYATVIIWMVSIHSNEKEQVWYWQVPSEEPDDEGDDAGNAEPPAESAKLFMDVGRIVR